MKQNNRSMIVLRFVTLFTVNIKLNHHIYEHFYLFSNSELFLYNHITCNLTIIMFCIVSMQMLYFLLLKNNR